MNVDGSETLTEKILADSKWLVSAAGVFAFTGFAYLTNELLIQTKHLFYHLEKVPHYRTKKSEINPEAFFDFFPEYVEGLKFEKLDFRVL